MKGEIEDMIAVSAPVERVGAALETAVNQERGWSLGAVDRERGTVEATLRAGWLPWVDRVRLVLESDSKGTTVVRGTLIAAPLGSRSLRRARLGQLLASLQASLGEE